MQQNTYTQNVDTSGNNNQQYFTQSGDIHIQQEEPEFFEPKLDQVQPPNYISPQITDYIVNKLNQQRLILLSGNSGINVHELGLHFAAMIQQSSINKKMTIKQWRKSSDPQSIDIELQQTDESTIFVLADIAPLEKDKQKVDVNVNPNQDETINRNFVADFYISQLIPILSIGLRGLTYLFKFAYLKELARQFFYYKEQIANILPEAIQQKLSGQSRFNFVLQRFQESNDKKIKIIVDLLGSALWIKNNLWIIIIIIVIIIFAVIAITSNLL